MKRFAAIGLGVIALTVAVPLVGAIPGLPNISAIAQNIKHQPQMHLELDVAKQVQDKRHISWESLQGQALVKPKDVLRYTISGENYSDRAVKNLALNQPIPRGMQFILKSATATNNAKITYSIDGGRSFSENPTIKVTLPNGKVETKPAPTTAYTHIHLNFNQPIPAKTKVQGTYEVQVL